MAIIVKASFERAVIGFLLISDKFDTKPFKLNIIQVYAATSNSNDDDLDSLYDKARKAIENTKEA